MGLKQKIVSYYINDEVMISSLGDDSLILGDMGAETYMLSIPTEKNKEFIAKFHKDKGYYPTWLRGKRIRRPCSGPKRSRKPARPTSGR